MTSTVVLSIAILSSLGLLFGALIAAATKKFWVWDDPRIDDVVAMLPGNNCGGCGQPGCRAFAENVVAGQIQPAQCTVMSPADVKAVADYLGVDAGSVAKRVARVLCGGGSDLAVRVAEYRGLQSCAAAATVAGGGKGCAWSCLGLADCERACSFHAIVMNDRDLPVVIPSLCTACGDCVEACPRGLFTLMPVEQKLIVQCRSLLEGAAAEALCAAACNGCGRCAVDAAPGLIRIQNGLAVIDYSRNAVAEPSATRRCPTRAIVWVEDLQFTETCQPVPLARSSYETACP
jgi:Na+-translocating ferredoxin:NAD+ oxidoreductase RNF subunit RnfB